MFWLRQDLTTMCGWTCLCEFLVEFLIEGVEMLKRIAKEVEPPMDYAETVEKKPTFFELEVGMLNVPL
jgi:hypothetical protein